MRDYHEDLREYARFLLKMAREKRAEEKTYVGVHGMNAFRAYLRGGTDAYRIVASRLLRESKELKHEVTALGGVR